MNAVDRVRERFQMFVQPFASSPAMRLRHSDLRWRDRDEALERVIAAARLPAPLTALYQQIESMSLRWSLPDDADGIDYLDAGIDIVGGEARIVSHTELLEGVDGKRGRALLDPYGQFDGEAAARLDRLVPFDFCAPEFAACLERDASGEVTDRVVFVPLDGSETQIADLGVGIDEYLDRGFAARFFYNWQKALFLGHAPSKRLLDHYLPQLF